MVPGRNRLIGTFVGIVVATAVLSGCGLWSFIDPHFSATTLTQDIASDTYALRYDAAGGAITVTANASSAGTNGRGVFWPAGQTATTNGESCARWRAEDGGQTVVPNIQAGAALRIRTNKDGSVDALTVTRNIYVGLVGLFNVHKWSAGETFTLLGQFDLGAAFVHSGIAPLPWNLCAEVIDKKLAFIGWRDDEAKPAYDDPSHGGQLTLPADYVYPGKVGWYIGHLAAGQTATFDELSASGHTVSIPTTTAASARTTTARTLDRIDAVMREVGRLLVGDG